ncbi:MAG TPA: aldolase [Burkholderiales bacterium]|nr:aldolase [Burkholderiales bacterium]
MDVSDLNAIKTKPSSRKGYDERQARVDLTAALRMAARMALNEGVCNHFSMELPGHPDKFLINPQGFHWSEITPADLLVVDENGRVLSGKHRVEPTAFFIHSRVHLRCKKKVVLHTHMPFATALAIIEGGRLDIGANQNAMRFHGRIAYDDGYGGVALSDNEGDRLAGALGNAEVMIMAHHGVLVCGERMDYAFDDLYYLERSCMVQVLAQSSGKPLRTQPDEVCAQAAKQIGGERQQSELHFAALKRLLDRDEPGWRGARR